MIEIQNFPQVFADALKRSGPIPPAPVEPLSSPLEVEGALASVPELLETIPIVVAERLKEGLELEDKHRSRIMDEFAAAITLIERQLQWATKANRLYAFLRYVALGHIFYPAVISFLRQEDKGMAGPAARDWLERRLAFGKQSVDYLRRIEERLRQNSPSEELGAKVKLWRAATMIDYVALPKLTSALADQRAIHDAIKVLDTADHLLREATGELNTRDIFYWYSKLYRHRAMACLKNENGASALLYLTISGLYGRQVRNQELFDEISTELSRGYAEAHTVLGNDDLVRQFLAGTRFSKEDLAGYVPQQRGERLELKSLPLHIVLVRHAERDTDEKRRFGFGENMTDRGRREFSYLGHKLNRLLTQRGIGIVTIFPSPDLHPEAQDIRAQLVRERPSLRADVADPDKFLCPIDVGAFRGLTEIEAQSKYPGTYRLLQEYRLGGEGYLLDFPSGESVLDFDRRVTRALCDVICGVAVRIEKTQQDLLPELMATSFVFLGHTSTLTAILNMLRSIGDRKLTYATYGFEPIETGSITELSVDLAARARKGEARRLPGGVEAME